MAKKEVKAPKENWESELYIIRKCLAKHEDTVVEEKSIKAILLIYSFLLHPGLK